MTTRTTAPGHSTLRTDRHRRTPGRDRTTGAALAAALLVLAVPVASAAPVGQTTAPAAPIAAAAPTTASAPTSTSTWTSTSTSTSTSPECQVIAAGRTGRAWLPWARLAVPGVRVASVDVTTGAASADLHGGTVLVQRTARRSHAAAVPVELDVVVVETGGRAVRTCTVDLSRPVVDPDHHVRRVSCPARSAD